MNLRKNRVELHAHSQMSLRDASLKVQDYVRKVREMGMSACALTEHGNMHSVIQFYKACKAEGIKPILGVEAYIIPTEEMAHSDDKEVRGTRYHLTLLAKNLEGYHQIAKAVTESQLLKDRKTFPRMTYDLMKKHFVGGNVIALSGCMSGELANILLSWKPLQLELMRLEAEKAAGAEGLDQQIKDKKNEILQWQIDSYDQAVEKAVYYESIFGKGNYFIELQNHGLEDELYVLPLLMQISRDTGIMAVATNDVHYVNKGDSKVREMLVALRFSTTINEIEKDCGELYLKSYEEMVQLFPEMPEAVLNSLIIADMCEDYELSKDKKYPKFNTPAGYTEASYLRKLAEDGIYWRYPDFDSWEESRKDPIRKRLDYELRVIEKLKYDGYLLIVWDFINYGRKFSQVGPGRGSAVGSLVCYLIGITNVDPIPYGLLFERFLNEDRVSDPDIDSDFDDFRDMIIEYVKEIYGQNAVCSIVTFGTLAARAAIRNAGRVTGVSLQLCDMVAKLVPQVPGITIDEALNQSLDLKEKYDSDERVKQLVDDARLIEGLVIQTGVHAAGVIIADGDISNYIPLLYDEEKEMWISQFDKDECEADCGLLKMDFLGLENLTIIKRTLKAIEKNHGVKITVEEIPLDDPDVIANIFQKGRTKAIFQFESGGMVSLLKRFQPQSLEDLILLNAAYRPGPMQYIDDIIAVKHNKKKPSYIIRKMESILSVTYGKPIYQEQIMRIFSEVAGFSLGVADIIRRAMAKKKEKELEKYLPVFKDKLVEAGAQEEDAEKFCEELMEFAKYAFNKSHSAAYAYLAYITAWLKHYYPVEYMANVLTSSSTNKLPVYIKECKDMGIPVLPPSVNESDRYFTPTKNGTIRFGLAGVKNVGSACGDIIEEREANGPYKTIRDFIERLAPKSSRAVYKQVMESLIMTGAFDDFKQFNRRQLMEGCMIYIADLKDYMKKINNPKSRPATIAKAKEKLEKPHFDVTLSDYDERYILEQEKKLIGFYASGHPLQRYQQLIDEKADTMIGDIEVEDDGNYVTIVGQINGVLMLRRKLDGAPMAKFTMEDMTGSVDCIAFTKAYADYGKVIKEGAIVVLKGRVMADVDPDQPDIYNLQVSVNELYSANTNEKVYVKLKNMFEWNQVKPLLDRYTGNSSLFVYLEYEDKVLRAPIKVRACQSLKEEYEELYGQKNIAIVT
jgi:DNA polymerase-3 subunit alpha